MFPGHGSGFMPLNSQDYVQLLILSRVLLEVCVLTICWIWNKEVDTARAQDGWSRNSSKDQHWPVHFK